MEELKSADSLQPISKERYLGKLEGFAWGILTLFTQDAIKKPSESLHFVKNLGLTGDSTELEVIELFIDTGLDNEEKINILTQYLQGNKITLFAHVIDHLWDEGYDDLDILSLSESIQATLSTSPNKRTIAEIEDILVLYGSGEPSQDDISILSTKTLLE